MVDLIEKLKPHLHWEDGMDDTMLPFYLEQAKRYVKTATGGQTEYLILMCAGIFYEYRIAESELGEALDAMTPFFVQEAFADGEEAD